MARLTKIENENKVGYKDELGNIVIDPIYDEGQLFIGSYLSKEEVSYGSVIKNGRCGIIDQKGNVIVPFEYDEAYHLLDNLFAVRKNTAGEDWVFGVIDNSGKTIIPFEYKLIQRSHRFIRCYGDASSKRIYSHRYMNMNTKGRIYEYHPQKDGETWYSALGDMIYEGEGVECTTDYLVIKEKEKLGVIDFTGKSVLPCLYSEIYCIKEDRFIVRIDNDSSWNFGVIDKNGENIIEFNYKYISHENSSFFECYEEALCETKHTDNSYKKYVYNDLKGCVWYNKQGTKVFEGKAKVLSDNYLAILSNDKWGVVTQSNKRIVNFLFDNIRAIQDKLVVVKDARLGILESDGSVLINSSYNKIECAVTDDNTYGGVHGPIVYGEYCEDCKFDTEDKNSPILNFCISYDKSSNQIYIVNECSMVNESKFDFDKVFILHCDNYCELFSIKDGIIPNSRFDVIRKLTNICFAVRRNNKWGVLDIEGIIIPCEYDRIVYEGGVHVFLSNGDLWGAKSLMPQDDTMNVDVPIKYKEIKLLDATSFLFGVKTERTKYDDSTVDEYTIVDKRGEVYGEMSEFHNLDRQCEIFDFNYDRIVASQNGKYGFISTKGYVTIPFQYDFIERRDDGMFNVQIDGNWGIIDIAGKEIVRIKYTEKIPKDFDNAIVQNVLTGRFGILSKDGSEKVPSIYEHLKIEDDFIYFGYNGYETDSDGGNFFSNIEYAIWGVMDNAGKVIIKPEYDCYKKQDGFLLAGRDGSMLCHDDSYYGSDYSGVYDLYTFKGELIFGGLSEFIYDDENEIYIFFLGGKWESYTTLVDEWNSIYAHDYYFNRDDGLWLFLDKNLKTIKRGAYGNQWKLKKGAICKITIRQQGEEEVHIYNFPIGAMAKGFERISYGNIIIADSNDKDFQKFAALNIRTGEETPFYQRIDFIDNSNFLFSEENKIGIRNYREIIENAEFMFMTYPVNGFYFVAKELDGEFSNVVLRSLYDSNSSIEAIKKIKTSDLIDNVAHGRLKIECEDEEANIENIILSKHDIFDESFICKVSKKQSDFFCSKFKDIYWFANDYRMKEKEYSGDNGDCDDHDYARDTWDAMTDGMYGDMPDGFDGDYSFIGY